MSWQRLCPVIAGLSLLGGCANHIGAVLTDLERHETPIELTNVPFHAQVTDQCGPAALATILGSSGVAASPDELRSRIYIPGRNGALQLEILAAARQYGRLAYVIEGNIDSMLAELQSGNPVLVMQNLASKFKPVWHYAVVVGYLPDEHQFVLRSGDRERYLAGAKTFLRSWQGGGYWAVIVLQPGDMPVHADADKYLRTVAALESADVKGVAIARAYRAAVDRWPTHPLGWLGLGNAAYSDGDLQVARQAYRTSLDIQPSNLIAVNNLAQVNAELGCLDRAQELIGTALSAADTADPTYRFLNTTRNEIEDLPHATQCL